MCVCSAESPLWKMQQQQRSSDDDVMLQTTQHKALLPHTETTCRSELCCGVFVTRTRIHAHTHTRHDISDDHTRTHRHIFRLRWAVCLIGKMSPSCAFYQDTTADCCCCWLRFSYFALRFGCVRATQQSQSYTRLTTRFMPAAHRVRLTSRRAECSAFA